MIGLTIYAEQLREALVRDNTDMLRTTLYTMIQHNVGEAALPGLKELCQQARKRLMREA